MRVLIAAALALLFAVPAYACSIAFELQYEIWENESIKAEHLNGLTCEELRILRNTAYARHGYVFGNDWVREQFEGDTRYTPDPRVTDELVAGKLSTNDRTNVALVLAAEEVLECDAYWASLEPSATEAAPVAAEREFVLVEIWPRGKLPGEGAPVEVFNAHPDVATYRAYTGAKVEGDWLTPFTCDELDLVAAAVYARYGFPFAEDRFTDFFSGYGTDYTPEVHVDNTSIITLLTSRDKHTLYGVRRNQRDNGCDDSPPVVFDPGEDTIDCSCHFDAPEDPE